MINNDRPMQNQGYLSSTKDNYQSATPTTNIEKTVKVQPSLLPWNAVMEICKLMTVMCNSNGGKHSKGQWKEVSIESHMDAAIRHYVEWHSGKTEDEESGLNPLAHMACRLLMALSNELEEESKNVFRKSD